jgi:hypothetical protein
MQTKQDPQLQAQSFVLPQMKDEDYQQLLQNSQLPFSHLKDELSSPLQYQFLQPGLPQLQQSQLEQSQLTAALGQSETQEQQELAEFMPSDVS